jgi:hypothetical protein
MRAFDHHDLHTTWLADGIAEHHGGWWREIILQVWPGGRCCVEQDEFRQITIASSGLS